MVACVGYGDEQCREEVVAVGVYVCGVVLKRQRQTLVGEQSDERALVVGDGEPLLLSELESGALRQLVEASLAYHPEAARVAPEEEVCYDAHRWQEREHKHPCHGLGWLLVVHEY